MKLVIEIEVDNAAFHAEDGEFNHYEVGRILDNIQGRLDELDFVYGNTSYRDVDINGNTVALVRTEA